VGHHSHNPQPWTLKEKTGQRKLCAYSIGNMGVWFRAKAVNYGLLLKIDMKTKSEQEWEWLGYEFKSIHIQPSKEQVLVVEKEFTTE
jgi:poly-gamma-glutamate capsule biosynthesis protein CapA/YwtB (metallophosphatase superfamily)